MIVLAAKCPPLDMLVRNGDENEHTTLRTLVLFPLIPRFSNLVNFSNIQFCFILCKSLLVSFVTHTMILTDLCC